MLDQGYTEVETPGPDVAVVLHFVDPDAAKPYRRKNAPTFVVVLAEFDAPPADMLRTGYPLLVRGLANLCVMVSPSGDGSIAEFVTLEQGTYAIDTDGGDDQYFFKSVFSRVEPLASSRLVIGNEFTDDLPDELRARRRRHPADHACRRAARRARPASRPRSPSRRSSPTATCVT